MFFFIIEVYTAIILEINTVFFNFNLIWLKQAQKVYAFG